MNGGHHKYDLFNTPGQSNCCYCERNCAYRACENLFLEAVGGLQGLDNWRWTDISQVWSVHWSRVRREEYGRFCGFCHDQRIQSILLNLVGDHYHGACTHTVRPRPYIGMITTSDHRRVENSYSYCNSPTGGDNDSLVIKLSCPRVASFKWCLKLYSMVMGGLGILLSFIWGCFHLYVLSQTSLDELRQQR